MAKKYESDGQTQLFLNRNIEFAIYNSAFAGMNGEKVFKKYKKPSDLYKLSIDNVKNNKEVAMDADAANEAILASGLVTK